MDGSVLFWTDLLVVSQVDRMSKRFWG